MNKKKCFKCKRIKNIPLFSKDKSRSDGSHPYCKKCSKEYSILYLEQHREEAKSRSKEWYKNNFEKAKLRSKKYKQDHPGKDSKSKTKWKLNHPGEVKAMIAKRRASKLKQTPAWANLEVIRQIYIDCPDGMEVDHIVPLQGKNVSGFHVEHNLQYLTSEENRKKGNKCLLQ